MPHRTVFQIGKNHAHPFTVFIGGLVIGVLVTGLIAWAWNVADETNTVDDTVVVVGRTIPQNTASPTASPRVSPSPTPGVSF